jgi:fructose 1,6-bisphosphatase
MIFGIVSEVAVRAKPLIADLFDGSASDPARSEAVSFGSMLRDMGMFEQARLGPQGKECTTLQQVPVRLKECFQGA